MEKKWKQKLSNQRKGDTEPTAQIKHLSDSRPNGKEGTNSLREDVKVSLFSGAWNFSLSARFIGGIFGLVGGLAIFLGLVLVGIKFIFPSSPLAYQVYCFLIPAASFLSFFFMQREGVEKGSDARIVLYHGLATLGVSFMYHIGINLFYYINGFLVLLLGCIAGILFFLFRKKTSRPFYSLLLAFLLVTVVILGAKGPGNLMLRPGNI
ncbi:MAG TPA: hypothetical protein VKO42_02935 [Patescibacteria group bacterium]|nr:hypothetical protein [Patescibacteria group bacterium]